MKAVSPEDEYQERLERVMEEHGCIGSLLIIGIDGLRPDCLEAAETPAIDGLIADGIFSPDTLNNDITYSGPGWSGMICGVWSDSHGVSSNNFIGSN